MTAFGNHDIGAASTEVAAAVEAGIQIAGSEEVERGSDTLHAFVLPKDTKVEVIDPSDPRYTGLPRFAEGTAVVWDAASFNASWTKYARSHSEVFADVEACTVTAIYDAHVNTTDDLAIGQARAGKHRTKLEVRKTRQWLAWEALDGKLLTQSQFAEHIEDRVVDFHEPAGGVMLELAQSFQATTNVDFESAQILSSSERKLVYKETVTARAGQRGDLTIPATFALGLKPFEGSDAYSVVARLRYRVREGNLSIGYKLERPEDVLAAAFGDVVGTIEAHVDPTPVLRGRPA